MSELRRRMRRGGPTSVTSHVAALNAAKSWKGGIGRASITNLLKTNSGQRCSAGQAAPTHFIVENTLAVKDNWKLFGQAFPYRYLTHYCSIVFPCSLACFSFCDGGMSPPCPPISMLSRNGQMRLDSMFDDAGPATLPLFKKPKPPPPSTLNRRGKGAPNRGCRHCVDACCYDRLDFVYLHV